MELDLPEPLRTLFQQAVLAQMSGDAPAADALFAQFTAQALIPRALAERHNLGVLLRALGRLDEALALLTADLAANPTSAEARYELGATLLALGDYAAGWPLYEARRDIPTFRIRVPALPFPEWCGEDLAGKRIVLFPEQGLGDNIQFARFALTLRDQGAQVVMLCRPALASLLHHSLDGVDVQAAEGEIEMGEPDFWALTCSPPLHLGVTLETIPNQPYLRAPNAAPRGRGGPLRIGLVTKGAPVHQNDAHRSLNAANAARLRALPGEIVSLHPEDSGARDFAATAGMVAGLDLVVTVDTSVAHLAGAMGTPVFILLPGFQTDWRWLRRRSDSPWYPSARLFRGAVNDDWSAALADLEAAVAAMAAS